MVEFDREINKEESLSKPQKKRKVFIPIFLTIIIMAILFISVGIYGFNNLTNKFNQQLNTTANQSYILGLQKGTEDGIILGKTQCPICPIYTTTTCSVCQTCESPNQTVLNLAKEQTFSRNMILYNGTNVVSLPLNQLCLQLQNGTSN
jgi:hypothetical protein